MATLVTHKPSALSTSPAPTAKPHSKAANTLTICIVTDAWHPQVNGVVRTLDYLKKELKRIGHKIVMVTPKLFKTLPCPTYPEIRLSVSRQKAISRIMHKFKPDAIHIATEGPLGWATRNWCINSGQAFTSAYHTAFPEYIAARTCIPARFFYPAMRRFHAPSGGVLVATETVRKLLNKNGFSNVVPWTRGVDIHLFQPRQKNREKSHPTLLYVGRVAVEKNIEAFLKSKVRGKKRVVGDGPALTRLRRQYPSVTFTGAKFGKELANEYSNADVFAFPSKTDTFGLVMIEALASGTPVAAYPVQGPLDVLGIDGCGPSTGAHKQWSQQVACLNEDLEIAIAEALLLNRQACGKFAKLYDWHTVAEQFVTALVVNSPHLSSKAPSPKMVLSAN